MADMERISLAERLGRVLREDGNVLLAYLFGSRAQGRGSPLSDYDVAVLLKGSSLRDMGRVLFAVAEALGVNEDQVDILDLSKAPISLKVKVLKEGARVLDRGYEGAFVQEVNERFPELALQKAKEIRYWTNNPNGIDAGVIKERLDYLAKTGDFIKDFVERHPPAGLDQDPEAWHALKSMVQDAVQAIIDICSHLVGGLNLGAVSSYGEYVDKLTAAGYMSPSMGEKVKDVIVLRNRLIHRYLTAEPQELWEWAGKMASDTIPNFKKWTAETVKAIAKS